MYLQTRILTSYSRIKGAAIVKSLIKSAGVNTTASTSKIKYPYLLFFIRYCGVKMCSDVKKATITGSSNIIPSGREV